MTDQTGQTSAVTTQYIPAPGGHSADTPTVFAVINRVMRDAMPVGKNQRNTQQNYAFRGIDDVMSAMAGPMRTHGLFLIPEIASHKQERRGEKMTHTVIVMRYHLYGPAGDCLVATVPGEASDFADKATNKAQSAALKYLLFTVFMLPVDNRSIDDGDRHHPENQPEQRPQQRKQRANRRRDYAAEARAAKSPDEFTKIRAAAEAAGAPPEYLIELDRIRDERASVAAAIRAASKPAPAPAAPAPAAPPAAEKPQAAADWPPVAQVPAPDPDREAAIEDMRTAAAEVDFTDGLAAQFQTTYGHPIEQGTTAEFREAAALMRGTPAAA